jgi:hypothetical protein
MERRYEIEYLRRSLAMLPPGRRDALDRERALALLDELVDVEERLDHLKHELRRLAEE